MIQVADIVVRLRADASGVTSGIGQAKSSLGGFATQIAVTGAAITAAFGGAITYAISQASNLAEALNKSQVVFGNASKGIEDFARSAATNLGLSSAAALDAAGSLGSMFKTMGLGTEAAGEFSKGVLSLSADLASFHNLSGGVSEGLEKLRAGIAGEVEPLRRLGIEVGEQSIKQQAMAMGLKAGTEGMSAQVKSLLRLLAILDQTKDAQGDFARTADGLANSSRILKAQIEDLAAKFGEKLAQSMQGVFAVGVKLLATLQNMPSEVIAVGVAVGVTVAAIGGLAVVIGGVVALIGGPLTLAIAGIVAVAAVAAAGIATNWEAIKAATGDLGSGMSISLRSIVVAFGMVLDKIAAGTRAWVMAFDIIVNGARIMARAVGEIFRNLGDMVATVIAALLTGNVGAIASAFKGLAQKAFAGVSDDLKGLANRSVEGLGVVLTGNAGKFAKAFGDAFDTGLKQAKAFNFETWRKDIEAEIKRLMALGGGAAGKSGAEVKKLLQEHASDISQFLEATGQKVKVTADRLKALPESISAPLLKVSLLFKAMKQDIELLNFERVVRGLPQLSDEFKILGKTIEAEFATIKALPPKVIEAFQKLGFKFKEIFPAMTLVVLDLSAALKESTRNAEMMVIGEAAMAKFADVTEKSLAAAEKALVTFTDQLEKMSKDVDFWVGQSATAFEAGRANIVDSVLRQGEDIAQSLGKTGTDIQKFGEQWSKSILENLVRSGQITQEQLDKMVEIHRKAAIKLPGIWESVLGKMSSRTKGMLSDVFGVIDTMPGKWGDAIRKTKSEIETWVSFIDNAVKLIQRLLGDQSPGGLGGILSGLSGMFQKTGSAIKSGFGSDIASALGIGGKAAGGAMKGLAGFMAGPWGAAIGIGTSLLGPLLGGLFKSGHQKRMEKMAEEQKRLEIQGLKEDLKKAMQETIQSALQTMQDALKLFDEMPGFAMIPKSLIASFFKNLEQVLSMFADMSGKFSSDLLKKVKEFADSIGPAISVIADAVEAFDKLAGFVGVSRLSIADFARALDGVLNALAEVRDGMEKRIIKLSRALAEKVMEAIEVIKSGVEAFTGLRDFQEIPASSIAAFAASLEIAITTFMEISQKMDFFLLKQAAKMAERMQAIVAVLGAGVEALKGILEFQSVPQQVMQSFADNLEMAINTFIELSLRVDAELVSRAATIAERMSLVLDALKSIPEVFNAFRDYKSIGSTVLSAIMQDFDAVAYMVEYLLDRAMRLKGNAEAFAEAVASIREALASVFGGSFLAGGSGGGGLSPVSRPGLAHGSIDPYFTRSPLDTSPDPASMTPHGYGAGGDDHSITIGQMVIGGSESLTEAGRNFIERLVQVAPRAAIALKG